MRKQEVLAKQLFLASTRITGRPQELLADYKLEALQQLQGAQ